MTQFIEPNQKSDLKQDIVRNWISQAYTGVVSGFLVTPGGSGFLLTISSGVCWISGTRIHDDETRIDFDLSIAGGVDKHVIIIARHTPGDVFPPPAMIIEAITNNDTTVPTLPADSVKLADVFIASTDVDISDSRIIQAPKLPARGNNDGDIILDRLINSNMNLVYGGGGSFSKNTGGANTTIKWTEDILLVSTTITNKEKFATVPLASYRIPAGTLGPDPGDFTAPGVDNGPALVRDNCLLFAVVDRTIANNPASPTDIQMRVIDLDDPDISAANTTDANLFYDPVREKIVVIGAITNGLLQFRSGISSSLPPPNVNPNYFLRNDPGGIHYWSPITEDLIVSILTVSALTASPNVVELGDNVGGGGAEHPVLSFSASYTQGPPTNTVFNSTTDPYAGDNPLAQDPGVGASFTYTGPTLQKTATGGNGQVNFQLTADAGDTPAQRNETVDWYRYTYWGDHTVPNPTLDNNFLKTTLQANGSKALRSGRGVTINFNIGGVDAYVFFAYPTWKGAPSVYDNNAAFDITPDIVTVGAAAAITTENTAAIPEGYTVYRLTNLQSAGANINLTVS